MMYLNFQSDEDLVSRFDSEEIVDLIKRWMKENDVVELSVRRGRDKNGVLYENKIVKITR